MEKLSSLNVVPGCSVQVIDEDTWKYDTLAVVPYTPRAINEVLKTHDLQSAWVKWVGGRELWQQGKGRLAVRA